MKRKKSMRELLEKLQHRCGEILLRIVEMVRGPEFYKDSRAASEIALLYPGKAGQMRLRAFYADKLRRAFMCTLLGIGLSAAAVLLRPRLIGEDGSIRRNTYGGSGQEFALQAENEDGETIDITVQVSPRIYTAKQARALLQQAEETLDQVIAGENASLLHVEQDLILPTQIGEVTIRWESGNYDILNTEGELQDQTIPERGISFSILGTMECEGESREYLRTVVVFPRTLSEEEAKRKTLTESVEQADREQVYEENLRLPMKLDDKALTWSVREEPLLPALVLLTVLLAFGLYWNEDQKLHSQLIRRSRQMDEDYADIMNKLVLLLGAGMTIRGAWTRIAQDYRADHSAEHREERFAYEEMLLCLHELERGIPEIQVYEHFGRRCGSASYLKLSALLTQNLRKGTKGLLELFRRESSEALQRRKNEVRQRGEEAGTRLLLPMFLMLAVVLMIVMVPAFLSLQI